MKKLFMKFCVVVLSCFMVFNTAYLPSYAEDEMSYYEQNDLANSFRYTDGDRHTGCYLFYGGRYAHAETTERRTAGFTAASLSR